MHRDAARSLERLLPRIERSLAELIEVDPVGWSEFTDRLQTQFEALFLPLVRVYGSRFDFFFHLERFLIVAAESWFDRPNHLRVLDRQREADPAWFQSNRMVGGVCYVDLFAGNLAGIKARIPYFREMGLTYLHLMPLFRAPAGNSDGGYAVSSYREVEPALGTMVELRRLADDLRAAGISLVLDFVFNHTSDEHPWALEARMHPDDEDRNCYFLFPDRTMPDSFNATVREIFPDQRPGSFSWVPDAGENGRWVWTTFNSFQWDLNYANPLTFERMAGEMLFLANQGVDILRLDAVAFIWKELGTVCESLPEAHLLVQAFNAMARIAAPALLFKSEAIVHPAEVATYISPGECQISYNPLLMALLWETLATRNAALLRRSMEHWLAVPDGCAWVNYVRSHDDIGWTFDYGDAASLGINGYDHRRFLNDFYTGRFPGSFARGLPFQENPKTGDCRISGTTASLAGLEKALASEGPEEVDFALRRIELMYAVALAIGGIPLLYLGDEIAMLNDYSYREDPARGGDSRWVHRPRFDEGRFTSRVQPDSISGRLHRRLTRLIALRKRESRFAGSGASMLDLGNDHLFGFERGDSHQRLIALFNVTEADQEIGRRLPVGHWQDLLTGTEYTEQSELRLAPYQAMWLAEVEN